MKIVVKVSNLYLYFNNVIETNVGSFSLFYLNLSIKGLIFFITIIINNLLAEGIDLNWVMRDILGITFIYFKEFDLTENESILFAKITPGWNITWNNETAPPAFNRGEQPVFDLTKLGLGSFLNEAVQQGKGIDQYLSEKLERAFDL
jgi:hypothetical protein